MSQLIEFAGNHYWLLGGFLLVTALIIKTELDGRLSGVNQVGPSEAVRLMDEDTLVLDVRESKEYSTGHIKNALHIPMANLSKRMSELEKYRNRTIIAYCRSGSRSNYACKQLKKAGFENAVNLAGGVMAWASANLPLTKK